MFALIFLIMISLEEFFWESSSEEVLFVFPYVPAGDDIAVDDEDYVKGFAAGVVFYVVYFDAFVFAYKVVFAKVKGRVDFGAVIVNHSVYGVFVDWLACYHALDVAFNHSHKVFVVERICVSGARGA